MKIGNRLIGLEEPPFLIAEAGINHNGEIAKAIKMVEVAKRTGMDAIKFQTFKAEEFVFDESQTYTYQSQGEKVTESMLEMFKRCEFTKDEWYRIKRKCDEEEIMFLSTPQNCSDLELLMEIGIPAIKVGSDDFTNLYLLEQYVKTNLPLILSCGMADLAEIYTSLNIVGALDGYPSALLLCTSEYPTPPEAVNIKKLHTLSCIFPQIVLGFSDHTQGHLASSIAVAFNARIFEKHFTLENQLAGPDHWFSENPKTLEKWKDGILLANKMLGKADIRPTKREENMRLDMRRSIIVKCDIAAGEILDHSNLGLYRPGKGLPSHFFKNLIGKKARKVLSKGHLIQWDDIDS